MAAEGATGTGAAAAARLLPPRPSGVGEVSELPPLLLLPAAPGFKRPMNEEVASDETEEVVVSSWERTRAAEGRGGRGRGGGRGRVEGVEVRARRAIEGGKKTRRRRLKKPKTRHAAVSSSFSCLNRLTDCVSRDLRP